MKQETQRHPTLGWVSVGNAAVLCALIVALPTIVVAQAAGAPGGHGSIGAAAGSVAATALLLIAADFAFGLFVAMAGVLRSERPLWVHGLGVSLNLGAPGIAIVLLRALYF